jgi:hypothetical protein
MIIRRLIRFPEPNKNGFARGGDNGLSLDAVAFPAAPRIGSTIPDEGLHFLNVDRHPEVPGAIGTDHDRCSKEARPVMVNEDPSASATRSYHDWPAPMSSSAMPQWEAPEL